MKKLPPIPKSFTSPIAERRLVVETTGAPRNLRVELGAPIQDVPTVCGFDWRCPIRFSGHSAYRRTLHAFGADSVQSLAHALMLIHAELTAIEQTPGTHLSWLAGKSHGFPRVELARSLPNLS